MPSVVGVLVSFEFFVHIFVRVFSALVLVSVEAGVVIRVIAISSIAVVIVILLSGIAVVITCVVPVIVDVVLTGTVVVISLRVDGIYRMMCRSGSRGFYTSFITSAVSDPLLYVFQVCLQF